MSQNIIPAVWAAGSFEALPPFDTVVKKEIFYTVEAVRTIPEMQALKLDLFKLVFEPVGVSIDDYQVVLERAIAEEAVVVALTSRARPSVYVISSYFKSFPLVDGVIYERLCIISDCGSVPPALKDKINSAIDHFNNYLRDAIGIANPKTTIGTIPTRGYVSKDQADAWENTRKLAIKEEPSDIVKYEKLLAENKAQAAYILELEAIVKTK